MNDCVGGLDGVPDESGICGRGRWCGHWVCVRNAESHSGKGASVRAAVLVFDQTSEAAAHSEVQRSAWRHATSVIQCVNDFTTDAYQAAHEATRPTEQFGRPR